MLYFSAIKNKKVYTDDQKPLGKLDDVLFLAAQTPLITKLSIKQSNNISLTIPAEYVKNVNGHIYITKEFKTAPDKAENELSVMRNLLDKQIIDVKGHKVIRVNDVTLQGKGSERPFYFVSGVDIGIRGILRWFNLERLSNPMYKFFHLDTQPHFLSWTDIQPLELARGSVQLKTGFEKLQKMFPEDLADYLEKTTIKNVNRIINSLDEKYAVDVINNLNTSYQAALFRRKSSEKSAKLIEMIDPDEAVDILLTLPVEKREEILNRLSTLKKKQLHELLRLSKTPIGGLISTNYMTISPKDHVKDVLNKIKQAPGDHVELPYLYVINENNQVVGVVKIIELLQNSGDTSIVTIMKQNVVVLHISTPREIAIKRMLRYKLAAIPVSDGEKHILGVVMLNDLVETIVDKNE